MMGKANMETKRCKDDKGVMVMVEATIYLPITIMIVVFVIYYGLFQLQQQALLHQVQRVGLQAGKEIAYPGYRAFGSNISNKVDFDWGDEQTPSAETIENYYKYSHNSLSVLYRELNFFGRSWVSDSDINNYLTSLSNKVKIFTVGNIATEAHIHKGVLVDSVNVKVVYSFPTPGALRYFGVDETMELGSAAFSAALNPTDFARNTDLAVDAVNAAAEMLGFSEGFQSIVDKAKKLIGYL